MKSFLGIFVTIVLSGCASWWAPKEPPAPVAEKKSLRYSEAPDFGAPSYRKYKKVTRKQIEDESQLQAQAGSFWSDEGQKGFLFSQNLVRKEGDILNIKILGAAQKQVDTKVGVIKKLLQRIESPAPVVERGLAAEGSATSVEGKETQAKVEKTIEAEIPIQVEQVQTRIVERLPDGNYRIKGSQPFMIGKREYKVIVTGLVRPEDFNDNGISSDQIIDPQFDVVSLRRIQ